MEAFLAVAYNVVIIAAFCIASSIVSWYVMEKRLMARRERRGLEREVLMLSGFRLGKAYNTQICAVCGSEFLSGYREGEKHVAIHSTQELRECIIVHAMRD